MKKGDKISVLDEDIKGVILSVNGEQIIIEDEFGFSHHFHKSQLVLQNSLLYEEISVVKKDKKQNINSKKQNKNQLKLDLHFDQLVQFPEKHDPWERMMIQKEKLIDTLEYCRENSVRKLEIIHGLGDGILQEMVYDVLRGYAHIEYEENEFFKHSSTSVEVIFYK